MNSQEVLDMLQWRYATKVFDPNLQISDDDWKALLESVHMSPSSLGLQLWNFLDIHDDAIRHNLRAVSWNQSQVTDASRLVIFCVRRDFDMKDVMRHLERIAEVRGVTIESLEGYKEVILGLTGSKTSEQLTAWMERQVYIALGFMMSIAGAMNIDTCALEGMDPIEYDRILNLEGTPYRSICALALGYRNAEADKYAHLPKVRFPKNEVIREI